MNKENDIMGLNIPDGYVFVKRGPGVAAALLEAADAIKADRKEGVRTTSQGGYYVLEAIASEWQKSQPEADEDEESDEDEGSGEAETPTADWTVAQIEEWAAKQDPVVDLGAGNKADKLKAALDSLESD
jgi:hypothetical protein